MAFLTLSTSSPSAGNSPPKIRKAFLSNLAVLAQAFMVVSKPFCKSPRPQETVNLHCCSFSILDPSNPAVIVFKSNAPICLTFLPVKPVSKRLSVQPSCLKRWIKLYLFCAFAFCMLSQTSSGISSNSFKSCKLLYVVKASAVFLIVLKSYFVPSTLASSSICFAFSSNILAASSFFDEDSSLYL